MDERSIFLNALEKNEPHERAKYLQEACGENQHLRRQVDELLRASRDAGEFLESPPAALVATIASGAFDAAPDTGDEASLDFLAPCDKPGCLGRLAQYEVVEVVGRGGMGLVLRAFDSKLNRVVAIKVMAPELAANPMAVKRFLREARAAAAVCHDHVVTIHSIHDTQRPPFLVMEFVDGQSLQQKIDRVGALELQEILRIGIQTASGLAAAHKQGLVHRDIKPANILLENGVERVKITDFGLARMNDDVGVTQTGQIAGTPQYMSPEQAQGQPVDARSDLFSLGSLLYTMCAGRPPFRGNSAVAMLRRVCDDDPRPVRQINADVPEWLEAIIQTLLAKNPDERFQSAEEVADLLGRHLSHLQNPSAVPQPRPIRRIDRDASPLQKPSPGAHWNEHASKERWGCFLTAGLVTALIVLAALAGGVWIYLETNHGIVVFESPVDDLEIERVKNGQVARVYDTLHGGGTQWHVPVGEWEFRIRGAGQDYRVHPNRIRVTRGDRITIRILPRSMRPTAESDGASITEVRRFGGLHTRPLADVALVTSAEGRLVATASYDGTVRIWDIETGQEARPSLDLGDVNPKSAAVSPDGKTIAVGDHEGRVYLWDVENGRIRRTLTLGAGYVYDLAFSPDGSRLYVGMGHYPDKASGAVVVYDVASGERLRQFEGAEGYGQIVAPLADGVRVLAGGEYKMGGVWDAETGRLIMPFRDLPQTPYALAAAPDGALAALGFRVMQRRGRFDDPDAPGIWLCDVKTGRVIRKLPGHTGNVNALAWSADGRFLVSGSGGRHTGQGFVSASDNTLRVWNVETGAEIARAPIEAEWGVWSLVLLPDGRHVVTAGGDEGKPDLRLWRLPESVWPSEATTETQIEEITLVREFPRQSSLVQDVALTPDGRHAVSGGWGKSLELWDVAAGSFLHSIELDDGVSEIAISPDGRRAVASGTYDTLLFLDLPERRIVHEVEAHQGMFDALTMSQDGKRVVTGGKDQTAAVWDTETGKELQRLELPFQCYAAAFVPDGRHVVLGGSGGFCQLWDLESGRRVRDFHGHIDNVCSAVVSADGKRLLTGCMLNDPTVRLWDLQTGEVVRSFHGHKGCIWTVDFLPEGQHILSGCDDGTMRVWSLASGREAARASWQNAALNHLAVTPDGRHVLSAGGLYKEKDEESGKPTGDYALRLWRLPESVWPNDNRDENEITEIRRYEGHSLPVSSLAVSRDGKRLVSGAADGTARVWDVETRRVLHALTGHHPDRPISVALSPDASRVATADADGKLRIWDLATDEAVIEKEAHAGGVRRVEYSADGAKIVTSGCDNNAKLWDAATGQLLQTFEGHTGWLPDVALSPDGSRVVTASFDESVRVWDTASGREVHRLPTQRGQAQSVAWSPDGRQIAAGFRDGTVRLFDPDKGVEIVRLRGHTDRLRAVAFTPDGRHLISGAYDRTMRIWNLETSQEIARESNEKRIFNALAVAPDGGRVYSAGGIWKPDQEKNEWTLEHDYVIRLWRLPATGGPAPEPPK